MSIESVRPSNYLVPFSFCLQSFPASGSFPVSQLFAPGGQSIKTSASASVFPLNIQDLFPLGLTGLIFLQAKGFSKVFSNTSSKPSILWCSVFFMVQLSHPYMTTGKTITLTIQTFVCKVMSLLFNTLSGFVIAFFLRSKSLSISWLPPIWGDLNILLNRVLLGDAVCDKSSGSQGCSSTVASSLEEVVITRCA